VVPEALCAVVLASWSALFVLLKRPSLGLAPDLSAGGHDRGTPADVRESGRIILEGQATDLFLEDEHASPTHLGG
jgi:hypothetical protein